MNPFPAIADRLSAAVAAALPTLQALDETAAAKPWAPGKWTRKQVLGHLIDSAANNHQRFVRGQEDVGELVGPQYAQNHWVEVQGYAEASWAELIALWSAYNRHLVRVVARIPGGLAGRLCRIGDYEPMTLEALAADYVDHLLHHLGQIDGTGSGVISG